MFLYVWWGGRIFDIFIGCLKRKKMIDIRNSFSVNFLERGLTWFLLQASIKLVSFCISRQSPAFYLLKIKNTQTNTLKLLILHKWCCTYAPDCVICIYGKFISVAHTILLTIHRHPFTTLLPFRRALPCTPHHDQLKITTKQRRQKIIIKKKKFI